MTKTQYREYIASADWQQRRKEFLSARGRRCDRCGAYRWLAQLIYDQDLHVHHKSYARLGNEDWEDLEPLCRRCHEVETFGHSSLTSVGGDECRQCRLWHFNRYDELCEVCAWLRDYGFADCRICGRDRLNVEFEKGALPICYSCRDILTRDIQSAWAMCDVPLSDTSPWKGSAVLALTLMAKMGVDNLLELMTEMEPFVDKCRQAQEDYLRKRQIKSEVGVS